MHELMVTLVGFCNVINFCFDSQGLESEVKDSVAVRKSEKADREKLRRDRLNEHFIELGDALDPDKPKNDKATILTDTIQLLKDLTSQVNKLKAEYATLSEESRELTQEKNDLREEKASLKSEIENLNIQYQQRARATYPWVAMDHSVVMAPTSYPFLMPMPIPPRPISLHPTMQPYPLFGNQNPTVIHNPYSIFVPYMTPSALVEQQSTQHATSSALPASGSHVSGKEDSKNKSSRESKTGKSWDSNDVTTELELKTPGSTTDPDLSSRQRKSKKSLGKENSITDGSSTSRCSSRSVQDSSSSSIAGSPKADDISP
ncbi:transcription factor bHLH121 [Ricinus communis]|uniref:transcription factor bHLH121 n=1 Tax=Ricinus communis TaxID=3988 RepID=UPI00201AB093|nr:transcription factor bHLH121 [Ricinus communis]